MWIDPGTVAGTLDGNAVPSAKIIKNDIQTETAGDPLPSKFVNRHSPVMIRSVTERVSCFAVPPCCQYDSNDYKYLVITATCSGATQHTQS